jgi:hypothetical protein
LLTGKGGGHKTAQGKAVVRWNAACPGITSPKPVVPGLEKQEDWEPETPELRAEVLAERDAELAKEQGRRRG